MPVLDEIATWLQAHGVGVVSGTIIKGSAGVLPAFNPADAKSYIVLTETGGSGPGRVQEIAGPKWQRPTVQIMVIHNTSYQLARTTSKAAYDALDGVWNQTLSGTFYQKITARQEPTDVGLEEGTNRRRIVFNIDVEKNPS